MKVTVSSSPVASEGKNLRSYANGIYRVVEAAACCYNSVKVGDLVLVCGDIYKSYAVLITNLGKVFLSGEEVISNNDWKLERLSSNEQVTLVNEEEC